MRTDKEQHESDQASLAIHVILVLLFFTMLIGALTGDLSSLDVKVTGWPLG